MLKIHHAMLLPLFAVATTLLIAGDSSAQIVPFHSEGVDNAYDTTNAMFGGEGKTRHMGKSSGLGFAIPTYETPLFATWIGFGFFEAANGDKIFFAGGGELNITPLEDGNLTAAWTGEFEITGGTGRFANVGPGTAPLDVIAINHPFAPSDPILFYDYVISGDMDLGKAKHK